jgi:hypothetical protein
MIAVLVAVVISTSTAASSATATPDKIDELCTQLSLLAENHEAAEIYAEFADPSDLQAPERWRAVPDRKTLERLADASHPYTQAFVWRIETGTFVEMLFESQSGDSVLISDYCFDSAGALRRSVTTLNTFHAIDPVTDEAAPVSRVNTTYFAPDGRVVETTTVLLDLTTFEPAPNRQFMDHKDPNYTKLADLPFSGLMPQ